jgi:signal transduction histidine kinase
MDRFSHLPTAPFKWLMNQMRQRENIHIPSLDILPPDASAEHKALTVRNIKSAVMVPMEAERKLVGFLGFDTVRAEKTWPLDVISLLKIVGEILANAFERHRAGAKLRQNDLRNRALLNAVPDLILRLNDIGEILDAKPSSIQGEITNNLASPAAKLRSILPTEAYDLFRQNIAKSLASGNTLEFQYSLPTPLGEANYEVRMCVSGFQEVTAFIRNITERVRLEQMKNDFINSATHELRTPVTTCLLMTDLIEEGGPDKEIQEYYP